MFGFYYETFYLTTINFYMVKLFTQPFQGLSYSQRTILLLGMSLMSLVAVSYSIIPLLFNRPQFQCTSPTGQLFHCQQQQACLEPELKYEVEYSFVSIPIQYNLYCSKKIVETNMLTLMMAGHFGGSVFNIFLAKIGNKLSKVLVLLTTSSLMIGGAILSLFCMSGPSFIAIILMTWAFSKQLIICFLYSLPVLAMKQIKQKAMDLQNLCWPIVSILIPFLFWMLGHWHYVLVISVAIPHLAIAYIIFTRFNQLLQDNQKVYPLKQLLNNNTSQQSQASFQQLFASSHSKNFFLFLMLYSCGYISLMSSNLYLNTLSGNIYINITIINMLQFCANIGGMYINNNLDTTKSMKIICIFITTLYLLYTFLPSSIQFLIIILGKVTTDFIWVLMGTYLMRIFPSRFVTLVAASKNTFSMIVNTSLPYVKFGMQSIGYSIFPISGAYYLIGTACGEAIQLKKQEEKQQKEIQMV